MPDSKKPGEPVEEERRALKDFSTRELVDEFRNRDEGVTAILGEHKTFTNPLDEPVRIFVVPEWRCKIIKPRLSRRIFNYMGAHRPPWWIFPLINTLGLIATALAMLAI